MTQPGSLRMLARRASYRIALVRFWQEARKERVTFERFTGRRLATSDRRAALQYAEDVLGSRAHAPWLEVFTLARGGFVEGWIPADFFDLIVMPHENGTYRSLASTKSFTHRVLQDDALPDVAQIVQGHVYDLRQSPIPVDEVRRHVFSRGERVIVKDDGGTQSRHVTLYDSVTFDVHRIAREHPNAAIQTVIEDHPTFTALSGTIGTKLRILTHRSAGHAAVTRGAYLALPRGSDVFTRAGVTAYVSVNVSTGITGPVYPDANVRASRHSDTNAPLENIALPGFRAAVATCERLHDTVPHLGVIGWDVMIDRDAQPWVIEWNTNVPNLFMIEAYMGPAFLELGWHDLRWSPREP